MRASLLLLLLLNAPSAASGDAGILYEVWHTKAAQAMAKVRTLGFPQLTTELVIQSQGGPSPLKLDDIYGPAKLSADIYNAQPKLGYYCLYRQRPGQTPPIPDCPNITAIASAHATMLLQAGFDYIALDITNWPHNDTGGDTDIAVLRPTEVLFEEWLALRARGINTPQIAIWPCSPAGATTWRYLFDHIYNNVTYSDLIYRQAGKKVVFLPYAGANCWDVGEAALIRANGGRNDVQTIPMWALFGKPAYEQGAYGFFSPCTTPGGAYTTSMVDAGPCNQFSTKQNGTNTTIEISASGGYMVSQCALPGAAPGHMRGLTVARLFERILVEKPPHVFFSSFNEYIGGRQAPASGAKIAINMGLPNDSQRASVWVDTYAAEFSRDIEPSVEGGDTTWRVASACVRLYKAGADCVSSPADLCCTRSDKEVFGSIWSMARRDGSDALLTQLQGERAALIAGGEWIEVCNAVPNPSAFCVNGSDADGRAGPFLLYNNATVPDDVKGGGELLSLAPLYRCITVGPPQQHFVSVSASCEGLGALESTLGYVAKAPGREMLRALRRCTGGGGRRFHALDLPCDVPDAAFPGVLGYVR